MSTPSLFNDVLGPVMRGPSSSHCAASLRIGRICHDLMAGRVRAAHVRFDPAGSLATTHRSQGSDMGLFSGLMGWEAEDERLPDYEAWLERSGIEVRVEITPVGADHPNTYCIELQGDCQSHNVTAVSTGGGMIEVRQIDHFSVQMAGDSHELLVACHTPEAADSIRMLLQDGRGRLLQSQGSDGSTLLRLQHEHPADEAFCHTLRQQPGVNWVSMIRPVLPVLTRQGLSCALPDISTIEQGAEKTPALWELALEYESARSGWSRERVWEYTTRLLDIMQRAVCSGRRGTCWKDRILPSQTPQFEQRMRGGQLAAGPVLEQIVLNVSALMEAKSALEVIVAAPTAGSCGAMPGALTGFAEAHGLGRKAQVRGLLSAGLIGALIADTATFAAEIGGCQAECGSGAGMAAAALTEMAGGTARQALAAASMALQNSFGMVCDPIANRVEAPCLGKNVMAASNALACANMALADYDPLIPLDQVIEAMHEVGQSIPVELRCTALGGLSKTPAAKAIEARLERHGLLARSAAGKRFKIC